MRVMDVVSVSVAASCATLAALHLVIWWKSRHGRANLWFALLAAGMAAFSWFALAMMRADTTAEYAAAIRWLNLPIFVMVVAITLFVRCSFPTSRAWLGHAAWGLRLLTLFVNVIRPQGMDYARIDAVHRIPFLGDTVSVAEGVTSGWHWVGQLAFVFLLWLIVDATRAAWRADTPEARRRARVIGVPLSVFVLGGPAQAALVFGGALRWPHVEFVPFLGLLAAMSYELCRDVLRAAQLTRELQVSQAALIESERQMSMAAAAARAAEAAAHELSGRLINAQEDERRRIARDLHDDVNQRLALLSVDLELLGRGPTEAARHAMLEQLATQLRALSSDVHQLSYQLHPAKLDQLGLVTAARGWCRDVSQQSRVRVEMTTDQVPGNLPPDIALALFRIIQESLRNVVRHSAATTARVQLLGAESRLELAIVDDGCGFDAVEATRCGGLGLVSMQERVRLLHGTLAIESRPGAGTRIAVSVPVPRPNDDVAGVMPERGHPAIASR